MKLVIDFTVIFKPNLYIGILKPQLTYDSVPRRYCIKKPGCNLPCNGEFFCEYWRMDYP